jgi:hypothetical protein
MNNDTKIALIAIFTTAESGVAKLHLLLLIENMW